MLRDKTDIIFTIGDRSSLSVCSRIVKLCLSIISRSWWESRASYNFVGSISFRWKLARSDSSQQDKAEARQCMRSTWKESRQMKKKNEWRENFVFETQKSRWNVIYKFNIIKLCINIHQLYINIKNKFVKKNKRTRERERNVRERERVMRDL